MKWGSMGLVAIGVAVGYLSAFFIHSDEKLKTPPNATGAEAAVASGSNPEREAGETQSRTAAPMGELESLRGESGSAAAPAPKTLEERMKIIEGLNARAYANALQQETEQLLAAGFSMDRIEWLRRRTDELDAIRLRADTERRQQGLPVDNANEGLVYIYDNDLDLVKEIGEDEYERYREALGRPNSIEIMSVRRGGIADAYGLKPGDKIVRYDGKRVYNIAEVNVLTNKNGRDPNAGKPDETVTIEVLRDGQPMRFTILKGDLSIGTALPLGQRSRALRWGVRELNAQH